nr:ATP synthase F0 subunit a [Microheliella maris]
MKTFLYTPLEQFEITPLLTTPFNTFFTNSSLFMLISVGTFLFIFFQSLHTRTLVPNKWQSFVESFYEFIFALVHENIGPKGYKYFPVIFGVFLFVISCNVIGMIPYSFTVTSHIIVTFGLALPLFIGITIIAFLQHGLHFFSFFLPKDVPIGLAPLLVTLELISYNFRVLSLAIRLFANMVSGHTLLKILAGFGWTMLSMGGIFYILHLVPVLIVFILTGLELGIALLQAYVFSILTCMYLSDAIHLH